MTVDFPVGADPASVRQRVEAVEKLLERSFVIPGLNRQVGLDAIVGLVPVAGDLIGASQLSGQAALRPAVRRPPALEAGGWERSGAACGPGAERTASGTRANRISQA